ncbi:hypothetical protein D3C74_387330 [compost metagenome]
MDMVCGHSNNGRDLEFCCRDCGGHADGNFIYGSIQKVRSDDIGGMVLCDLWYISSGGVCNRYTVYENSESVDSTSNGNGSACSSCLGRLGRYVVLFSWICCWFRYVVFNVRHRCSRCRRCEVIWGHRSLDGVYIWHTRDHIFHSVRWINRLSYPFISQRCVAENTYNDV